MTNVVETTRRGSPAILSGKLTLCYWTWPFIVDLPIKNDTIVLSPSKMCVRNDQPPHPAVTSKHWGEMGRSAGPGILRLRGRVEGWASLILLLKTLLPQVWEILGCQPPPQWIAIPNPPPAALSLLVSWLVGCKTGHAIRALGNFPAVARSSSCTDGC